MNIEKDGARCGAHRKDEPQDQRSFRHEDGTGGIVRNASAPANLSSDVAGSAAPDARNGFQFVKGEFGVGHWCSVG